MKPSLSVALLLCLALVSLVVATTGEWGVPNADPEKKLRQCQSDCDKRERGQQQKSLCRSRCRQEYEREKGEGNKHEDKEEEKEEDENPYVFESEDFTSIVKSQHGRIGALPKFTDRSWLLRGIENHLLAIIELNPQAFITPFHADADCVLFVAQGRGAITILHEDNRESFNIEQGNAVRVPAGAPTYLINRDVNQKLYIIKLLRPVNLPGHAEPFHSAGGGGQDESFYEAFSWELLEAALKTDRRRLEKIFSQKQGAIVKASKEQIQSMSQGRAPGEGQAPGKAGSSFNLLTSPKISNNHGKLFEAKPEEHKQQLQDLDLAVTLANITRGSMLGPFYNSKATKISVVLEGEGYFEMACPHVRRGNRKSEEQRASYHKVRSELKQGTVFIVPAGHPVAAVASENNNLAILCFEVNAWDNTRYPLAGKNNVVKRLEREAKELAFGVKSTEVDQAFGNEEDEMFFPGPKGGRQGQGDLFVSE